MGITIQRGVEDSMVLHSQGIDQIKPNQIKVRPGRSDHHREDRYPKSGDKIGIRRLEGKPRSDQEFRIRPCD